MSIGIFEPDIFWAVTKQSKPFFTVGKFRPQSTFQRAVTAALALSLALLSAPQPPSFAAPGDSIALYFSAPFVTGSHVTENALTETFNSYPTGNCPLSIPFATLTYASNCLIQANAGTSAGSSEPAVGVPNSGFVSKTDDTTFTFTDPVKYVGFWWLMGSNGNTVEFQTSTGSLVASFDMNNIISFLGSNSLVTNADTRTVTRVDGGTHLTKRFYRSPGSYTGTVASPVMDYNVSTYANEPWVYMNLFVTGSVEVSKVRFRGVNFEIDNLTVSTTESGPRGDMVLVSNVLGTPPSSQVISWAPTNTTISDGNSPVTPSAPAVVTTPVSGGGAITYSVVDAGTSGCTVNSVNGVIAYTAMGDCVVRATAAAVPGTYYSASTDVRFSFTVSPAGPSGPTISLTAATLAATGTPLLLTLFGSGVGLLLLCLGVMLFIRGRIGSSFRAAAPSNLRRSM